MERFRWMMPIPPSRARAMARRASVTVSMAADTIGICSEMLEVSRAAVDTWEGKTCDRQGTRATSSNVNPSLTNLSSTNINPPPLYENARAHGHVRQKRAAGSGGKTMTDYISGARENGLPVTHPGHPET